MEERLQSQGHAAGRSDQRGVERDYVARVPASRSEPGRSAASFLGPTGVGKTELARRTGRVSLRQRSSRLFASTCREYQEKHTVSRMIGAPPGYVGYEESGQLTEAVRRRSVRRRTAR